MNIQKITTYIVATLGVLGAVFVLMIVAKGDDAIEMSAMQGDYGNGFLYYSLSANNISNYYFNYSSIFC